MSKRVVGLDCETVDSLWDKTYTGEPVIRFL